MKTAMRVAFMAAWRKPGANPVLARRVREALERRFKEV